MSFIEQRLLDRVAYGTQGGPTWSTRRVPLRSGVVRRKALRSLPLYRFLVLYGNLQPDGHAQVLAAFNAARGGLHSFRLKDWSDFTATDEVLATGTGASQTVQLVKTYTFGTESIARAIRKPVTATVALTANNVPIAHTIDSVGVVTFTATNGHTVRWSGEFDVPVMFEQDELLFAANNRGPNGLFLTADVGLVEDIAV